MSKMGLLAIGLFALVAVGDPAAVDIIGRGDRPFSAWTPDDIEWDEQYADGSKLAILEGPRDRPGRDFSYAFFLPDGVWVPGHWHCADARVFVAQGTMLLGLGTAVDESVANEYPQGSYLIVPHREPHFEAAKGDLLIIGTGRGPWCTVETEGD